MYPLSAQQIEVKPDEMEAILLLQNVHAGIWVGGFLLFFQHLHRDHNCPSLTLQKKRAPVTPLPHKYPYWALPWSEV